MADLQINNIPPLHVQAMEANDERQAFVAPAQETIDHLVHVIERGSDEPRVLPSWKDHHGLQRMFSLPLPADGKEGKSLLFFDYYLPDFEQDGTLYHSAFIFLNQNGKYSLVDAASSRSMENIFDAVSLDSAKLVYAKQNQAGYTEEVRQDLTEDFSENLFKPEVVEPVKTTALALETNRSVIRRLGKLSCTAPAAFLEEEIKFTNTISFFREALFSSYKKLSPKNISPVFSNEADMERAAFLQILEKEKNLAAYNVPTSDADMNLINLMRTERENLQQAKETFVIWAASNFKSNASEVSPHFLDVGYKTPDIERADIKSALTFFATPLQSLVKELKKGRPNINFDELIIALKRKTEQRSLRIIAEQSVEVAKVFFKDLGFDLDQEPFASRLVFDISHTSSCNPTNAALSLNEKVVLAVRTKQNQPMTLINVHVLLHETFHAISMILSDQQRGGEKTGIFHQMPLSDIEGSAYLFNFATCTSGFISHYFGQSKNVDDVKQACNTYQTARMFSDAALSVFALQVFDDLSHLSETKKPLVKIFDEAYEAAFSGSSLTIPQIGSFYLAFHIQYPFRSAENVIGTMKFLNGVPELNQALATPTVDKQLLRRAGDKLRTFFTQPYYREELPF